MDENEEDLQIIEPMNIEQALDDSKYILNGLLIILTK